jgi:hypothetical protein
VKVKCSSEDSCSRGPEYRDRELAIPADQICDVRDSQYDARDNNRLAPDCLTNTQIKAVFMRRRVVRPAFDAPFNLTVTQWSGSELGA